MQWKFSLGQKIRIAATLVVIFLVVLATNLMDNRHFADVQKSLRTVYEDRLVAKDYIYKLHKQLQRKQSAWQSQDKKQLASLLQNTNDSIQTLVARYAATKLTPEEAYHFKSLQQKLEQLQAFEAGLLEDKPLAEKKLTVQEAEGHLLAISQELDTLAEIQLKEGKREINATNHLISTSNLISRIEIGALILIGFMLQMLIFAKPLK